MKKNKKILFSTDIGSDIDDALALLVMLNRKINLKGIYTVNGDVNSRAFIARHMVDLAKKRIQIATGEQFPLYNTIEPYSNLEEYLVDDKFIDLKKSENSKDVVYKPIKRFGIKQNAVKEIAKKLSKSNYVIFNTAPITNIAKLIQEFPNTITNIERLYVMGCRFSGDGYKCEENEHNIRYDPEAAKLTLNSKIPITIVPGDLCSRYRMPVKMLDSLKSSAGKYVKKMADAFIGGKTAFALESKMTSGENLTHILENFITSRLPGKNKEKDKLIVNLNDVSYAYLYPDEYWEQYHKLIRFIENPENQFRVGEKMANELRRLIPKKISIADVYVPYCFLHPEKLKTENRTVKCDNMGVSCFTAGTKHEVVRDLDFNHFRKFLKEYLF